MLHLKPTRTLNIRLGVVLLELLMLGGLGAAVVSDQLLGSPLTWLVYGASLGLIAALSLWLSHKRSDATGVAFEGQRLTVPVPRVFGRRALTVDVAALSSIELTRRHGSVLTLGIPGRFPVVIRSRQVASGSVEELYDRLCALSATVNPRWQQAHALFERRNRVPVASLAIFLALAVAYYLSQAPGANSVHQLIAAGGLNNWLITHGEIHRLGAAAMLHGNLTHVLVNLTFLVIIGLRLEYVVGPWMLAGACSIGMLAGNVCAYLVSEDTLVVGASGGLFGLLALYVTTIWRHHGVLPSRTVFGSYAYLLIGLAVLFVPLPDTAYSAHVGGFLGGALWSLAAGRPGVPRRLALWFGGVAWAFVLAGGIYGIAHRDAWLAREPALIERMAADPVTAIGTLNLVGWYALEHDDPRLQAVAITRLEGRTGHTAGSLGTLAELLLEAGEPARAAVFANAALERRSDPDARSLLLKSESAAYATRCHAFDYAGLGIAPPRAVWEGERLTFQSAQPLYVHAMLGGRYLLIRSGLTISMGEPEPVTVLGFGGELPWQRKPWILVLPPDIPAPACTHDR